MTTPNNSGTLEKIVAFLAGLSFYQLPYLALATGKYTLGRFMISPSFVSIYINRINVSFRIITLLGITTMTVYSQCKGRYKTQLCMAFFPLLHLCYIFLLFVYASGGAQGHMTLYYWGILIGSFVLGLCFTTAVEILSANVVCLLAALPMAGIVVSLYHLSFLVIGSYVGVSDVNYWLVVCQIIMGALLTGSSAILYIVAYWNKKDATGGDGGDPDPFMTALAKAWSPILLITLGYGLHSAFYSAIAPYKLIGVRKGYTIDMTILFTSAIAPLSVLVLKEKDMGPNKPWRDSDAIWHASWIFFVIEVFCAVIFACSLHFPEWRLTKVVRSNALVLGFLTVLYDTCAQATRTIGTNGADTQGQPKTSNNIMNTFNTFTYSLSQVIFAFLGDGYVKTYSKYEHNRERWPTKHYTNKRAFWFWTWSATKVSYHTLGTAFTTDLRSEVIGKKELLFIVYADDTNDSSKPTKAKDPKVMKIIHGI